LIGLVPCKLGHVLELYGNGLVQNLFDFSIVDAIKARRLFSFWFLLPASALRALLSTVFVDEQQFDYIHRDLADHETLARAREPSI
jgi:hypothetical protein